MILLKNLVKFMEINMTIQKQSMLMSKQRFVLFVLNMENFGNFHIIIYLETVAQNVANREQIIQID